MLLTTLITAWPAFAPGSSAQWLNTSTPGVQDYAANPILKTTDLGEWLLGDPTLIVVNSTLHLFANEVFHGIVHYSAPLSTPEVFTKLGHVGWFPGSQRPSVDCGIRTRARAHSFWPARPEPRESGSCQLCDGRR